MPVFGRVVTAMATPFTSEGDLDLEGAGHLARHLVDHGALFHGFANLFEGGIRVPAIIRFPGRIPAGSLRREPVISMDLAATILHATGQDDEALDLDGIDLLPFLSGEMTLPERAFYWQADLYDFGKQRAIRSGNYKYMEHGNTQFLFDLENDMSERDNLFADLPEVRSRLRTELTRWQRALIDE